MLLLHPFILTLCSCCINDGVNYIIQNLMLVGNHTHNLIECLSNLPNKCNSVVDVLHHMLQNLKVVRAASSNSPLLFRHDTHSKTPRRQVPMSKEQSHFCAALPNFVQRHQHHVKEVLQRSVQLGSPCVAKRNEHYVQLMHRDLFDDLAGNMQLSHGPINGRNSFDNYLSLF